jgi:hypothetical protein
MCRKLPIYNQESAERIADERNRFHASRGTGKPDCPLSIYFCRLCHAYHLGKQFDPRSLSKERTCHHVSAS